jgi:hypothetical protein
LPPAWTSAPEKILVTSLPRTGHGGHLPAVASRSLPTRSKGHDSSSRALDMAAITQSVHTAALASPPPLTTTEDGAGTLHRPSSPSSSRSPFRSAGHAHLQHTVVSVHSGYCRLAKSYRLIPAYLTFFLASEMSSPSRPKSARHGRRAKLAHVQHCSAQAAGTTSTSRICGPLRHLEHTGAPPVSGRHHLLNPPLFSTAGDLLCFLWCSPLPPLFALHHQTSRTRHPTI